MGGDAGLRRYFGIEWSKAQLPCYTGNTILKCKKHATLYWIFKVMENPLFKE